MLSKKRAVNQDMDYRFTCAASTTVSFYLRCRIPDSYVAVCCVLFSMTLSSATEMSFIVISVSGCNAPLVRAVKLLSMRAPAQVSSELVVCVEGETKSFSTGLGGDSGRGCLVAVVLCGTDRAVDPPSHTMSHSAADCPNYMLYGAPTLANAITGRRQSGERLKAACAST